MKNMTGNEIRAAFLKYFEDRGHTVVASSSLVPHDDPTLLFTNAGMNQFKDVFLGKAVRDYKRATTCQKVVRAGGKHNDLENVGRTARHHTFFEMLGNFSFGDYFKKQAIEYAWEFLTKVVELPVSEMFVTVYESDDEAFNIWRDGIGLPESKILRRGESDNFWQMGDTGPCGPCSEIFIDRGVNSGCRTNSCSPDCECDRHLEIWNLVFMQYNRDEEGVLHPLPKPSIDTGMGLERVASIVQNVETNYDTDLLLPIINYISELTGVEYKKNDKSDVSLRVIADHARSTAFLIADGVLPSNEGRGYVLRRIMRRAMRHGSMLNASGVFFHKVCCFVIDFMKSHYIELSDKRAFVDKVVQVEEESFSRTMAGGLKMIGEILENLPQNSVIPGETVFKLYDTYGFPVDLLADIVEDAGYKLDMEGFDKYMKQQQEMAKKGGLGVAASSIPDVLISLGSTMHTEFTGYDNFSCEACITAIVHNETSVESAIDGNVDIITDKTVFYPEGGGQTGDTGIIKTKSGEIKIYSTIKCGDAVVHRGNIIKGSVSVNDEAELCVDIDSRKNTQKNHTATHLLHKALQTVLGEHARQAGSSVTPDSLRFDFSHFSALEPVQLKQISDLVNEYICKGLDVIKVITSHKKAVESGATALFGEKYGERVRIVSIGEFSKEFCGGCHVTNTSEINAFVITSVSSVASGVRRIEALTGQNAINYLQDKKESFREITHILKCQSGETVKKVAELVESLKDKERILKEAEEKITASKTGEALKDLKVINGINALALILDNADMDMLRKACDTAVEQTAGGVIVLAVSASEDKISFVCRVSKNYLDTHKAGAIIKEVAKVAGGSGGGRDDMAQAGGKEPAKLQDAVNKFYTLI